MLVLEEQETGGWKWK